MTGSMLRIYNTRDLKLVRIRENREFDFLDSLKEPEVADGDVFELI